MGSSADSSSHHFHAPRQGEIIVEMGGKEGEEGGEVVRGMKEGARLCIFPSTKHPPFIFYLIVLLHNYPLLPSYANTMRIFI